MVPANWDGTTWIPGSQVLPGGGGVIHRFLFPVTARNTVSLSASYSKAQREKKNIFIRGFKEVVHIETTTAAPWQWRRIVFSVKALSRHASIDGQVAYNSTDGYMRGVKETDAALRAALEPIIFQGKSQTDWLTSMVAPINTSSVTLHSDVTRSIQSGNGLGQLRTYHIWTPINKSLVYNDVEDGPNYTPSRYSVDDKRGMGDLYCFDLFRSSLGSIAADVLDWRPNCTLYWHER